MRSSMAKKGFTLVEMLGVLIILGIIYAIMFPNITKMIKNTDNSVDEATTSIIESATDDYLVEKADVYPINDKYTYCITVTDLVDNANLTEKQISNLDDKNKIIEVEFENKVPTYQLSDSCTENKSDVNFHLIGDDKISYEVGDGGQYVEQGAVAKNKAGDLIEYETEIFNYDKDKVSYVDSTKIGIYVVKYSARIDDEDYAIERTVKIIDTTAPLITLASSKVTISVENTIYDIFDGVSSSDNSGEKPKISVLTNLILGQSGKYTVKFTATDSSGNSSTISREIIISSGTLIKMNLSIKEIDFEANSGIYIDEPATAIDENGIDVSNLIKTTIKRNNKIVESVDTSILGTCYINYSITKDNVTYSETKKVNIVDTTPPILNLIINSRTTNLIVLLADATDAQSGITKYEFAINSGSYIDNGTTSTYAFTGLATGSYTLKVRVTNGAGTTSETSIEASPNEIEVPTYSIDPVSTYATSKTVTVTYPARQTDFVYTYSIDGGTNWTTVASGTTASYTFTSNGSIIAKISDGINYKTASSYTVSGIDTTAPTVSLATSGMTTKTINVTATASDAQSGITKYEFAIDSGSYINNGTTATYAFTGVTTGSHTLKVRVTNGAGTTSETSIAGSPSDITVPTYSISPVSTYATSKTVTVTYPARQTDFVYTYSVDGGTSWTTVASGTTASYTFTSNGSIIARIYDGVNYKNASSYTVSGVDTTAPTVSLVTNGMTTKAISVLASAADAQSGITKYEFAIDSESYINNGTTASYTFTGVTTGSHTIKVKVTNGAGTTSETSITSSPNEIEIPTYSINPVSTYATSKTVTVTYPARQTDFLYTYSIDGGTNWTTVASGTTASYTFTSNGSIIARIYDGINYKNASSYTVSGIDTTAPTVSLATSGMTTKTINVTATASDAQSGITKYEFAIDSGSYINNGTTANYTFTGVTTGSHTLKVRVTNGAGTTSETSITSSPNDITVPTYSINPVSTYATSKIVTVTYPARQTDFVYTYSVDGGTNWTTVASGTTASYTFTSNGSIIARIYDGINYKTASSYTVSGIDTTAPTVSLATSGMTTKTINVTATASDAQSGITKYEFAIDSGSYINNGTTATYAFTGVTTGSHTLKVRVTNGAGTTSETSIAGSPNDITVPTYSIAPATTYATSKVVTVTYPARQTDFVYTYSIDGGTNWTTVASGATASYTFTSNGSIIARIYDGVNYKNASSYTVSGVDTTAPTVSLATSGMTTKAISVLASAADAQSGITKYEFAIDSGSYINNGATANYTFTGVTTGSHTLKVRVTNGAGTTSETSIMAGPNDITVPTYSISPVSTYATSKTVTVTYPARQTDFVYTYSVNGGSSWTTVASGTTASYAFTSNGSIIARIYDGVNYKTASTYTVSGIDTTAPTYTGYEIKNITYYGYDVYIYGVSDSQSGINRVQFPTWTDTNGQDDLQPSWSTNSTATGVNQGSGTWYFRVNVTAHNNESGQYQTHIWWYDNVGNANYVATVGAKVPANPYGTMIQDNYPNLYLSDNPTVPFAGGEIVPQNGNYNRSIYLKNYLTTKYIYHEKRTNLVPGENNITVSINYINQWVAVNLNFRESYSLQYGNYRIKFADGAILNPEQAVANGYIAPLVVISGSYGWNYVDSSPYYQYAWDGFYNLKNGGTTGGSLAYASDNLGVIIFKVMNKSAMTGVVFDCSNYTGTSSGFEVWAANSTFDISTVPF